ncbi:MAG: hypothetical protein KJ896_05160 [Nanoarchaeota archaeon]|nr:hypothetical protein [Nanoarchaeota archaeon]
MLNLDKKAQANTFWIIIGAVIALIVMIVLLLMFTGNTKILGSGLVDCEAKGGKCDHGLGKSCPDGYVKQSFFTCNPEDWPDKPACCVGSEEKSSE